MFFFVYFSYSRNHYEIRTIQFEIFYFAFNLYLIHTELSLRSTLCHSMQFFLTVKINLEIARQNRKNFSTLKYTNLYIFFGLFPESTTNKKKIGKDFRKITIFCLRKMYPKKKNTVFQIFFGSSCMWMKISYLLLQKSQRSKMCDNFF